MATSGVTLSPGDVELVVRIDGVAHAGSVVELRESELVACFASPWPATNGAPLAAALVVRGSNRPFELPRLECRHVDGANVTLAAPDPDARAPLWHALVQLRSLRDGASGPLPRIPARGQYTEQARLRRLEWLREQTHALLAPLQSTTLAADRLTGNIENLVGAVEVPVGIAGPLLVHGEAVDGLCYAPMATTEGALVSSATRGAMAISRSGGVRTMVLQQRMMRAPLFVFSDLKGAMLFAAWLRDHFEPLRAEVRRVSKHAHLVSVDPVILGNHVHVYFLYETGDAAGQNMTTVCTWQACQWLMGEMKALDDVVIEHFIIEANMSGEKKVNYNSLIRGRGIRVVAECVVRRDVLKKVLDVTPEQLLFLNAGAMAGSIQVGTVGYNLNVSNVIAAVFTATGQDIACVHESSLGLLHMQPHGDDLYVSLVLPSLIVGTVGGGTHLPAQSALLEMMGCYGRGKVSRLAEIIAGFCLSLDLSSACAIASGQFVNAHDRLGRNRPVRWFDEVELDASFFEPALRATHGDPALEVLAVEPLATPMGSSIITELTARKLKKWIGFASKRVQFRSAGAEQHADVFVKSKPVDEETMLIMGAMALMCGPRVAAAWQRFRDRTPFRGCHVRELGINEQRDPRFTRHAPAVVRVLRDDAREAYVLATERLHDVELADSADDVSGWDRAAIETALRGLAEVQAIWLGRESELLAQPWLGPVLTTTDMVEMQELWDGIAMYLATEIPELMTSDVLDQVREATSTLARWWPRFEAMPRTLIHNDFNPRNIALRRLGGERRLVAYDWELATLHVPQHDLAELLAFVLGPAATADEVGHYVELHRRALALASGRELDPALWREGYALSLRDLLVHRTSFYMLAHTFRHYAFMERVLATLRRLLDLG